MNCFTSINRLASAIYPRKEGVEYRSSYCGRGGLEAVEVWARLVGDGRDLATDSLICLGVGDTLMVVVTTFE